MQNHDFYLALAYGVSALLLVAEVALLCVRWRKAPSQPVHAPARAHAKEKQ